MRSVRLRGAARSATLALAAAGLSGVSLHLGTGLRPVWWLAWLAPLPVAWAAPRLGGWAAYGAAALAWVIGALNEWSYFRSLHLPPAVAVAATVLPALVFGLGVALLRAFARRGAPIRAALALPVVWVSSEVVQAATASHGTFGSLAYTQAENLPVIQLAAALGIWGVTFALLFFPAACAVALTGAVPPAGRARLLGLSAGAAAAVLGFGLWRLHAPGPSAEVTVGLAASDDRGPGTPPGAPGAQVLRDHLAQAEALARRGARLVVLPEKLAALDGPGAAEADAAWQAVAERTGATLTVGVARSEGVAVFNEARVYRRGAPEAAVYRKRHLLPGWESRFTAGEAPLAVADAAGRWGLAICKDLDFPASVRAYRDEGVALVLVPAWDFEADAWLHARMAVVRGVENGLGVVRSARQGLLTVSDARGRIVAERPSSAAPFSTLVAAVPLHREGGGTPYARIGDAFGWACLAGAAALLLSLRRSGSAARPTRG